MKGSISLGSITAKNISLQMQHRNILRSPRFITQIKSLRDEGLHFARLHHGEEYFAANAASQYSSVASFHCANKIASR
jgi:hypothetical protein